MYRRQTFGAGVGEGLQCTMGKYMGGRELAVYMGHVKGVGESLQFTRGKYRGGRELAVYKGQV